MNIVPGYLFIGFQTSDFRDWWLSLKISQLGQIYCLYVRSSMAIAGCSHCVLTRKICLACYMGDGFQFVVQWFCYLCVLRPRQKNLKKLPKTQNNSWHIAFRRTASRTRRSIDRFARSIWRFLVDNILFQCDFFFFFSVNCNKAFWPLSPDYLSAQVFSQMFSIKDSLPFVFCFCFFNWYSWVMPLSFRLKLKIRMIFQITRLTNTLFIFPFVILASVI